MIAFPLITGALLFALGLLCIMIHRSVVRVLLGIELMLNASILNFIYYGLAHADPGGAVFAIAVMAGAAAEAAVGLALVFALFAVHRHSDVESARELSQ